MAVRVEPSRQRAVQRYPGLTPEERGGELADASEEAPAPEPESPLWVLPSEMPQGERASGFVGPLPESSLPEPLPPEGLFDVPGLLERLWLARALEAAHLARTPTAAAEMPTPAARRAAAPVPAQSGAVTTGALGIPPIAAVPPPTPSAPREGRGSPSVAAPRAYVEPLRPGGWICPHCYLTNDATSTTCRGCKSGALHL